MKTCIFTKYWSFPRETANSIQNFDELLRARGATLTSKEATIEAYLNVLQTMVIAKQHRTRN